MCRSLVYFFFNDTATTEIYTLSLHDALPISRADPRPGVPAWRADRLPGVSGRRARGRIPGDLCAQPAADRKSTRLNSSHANISYAVFCLKKKKITSQRLTSIQANITYQALCF